MKLYLAYGANTNLSSMAHRCPQAKYICNLTLTHHRLVFRGVADVIPARNVHTRCALWALTPEDEASLDVFEGFPHLYVKKYLTIRFAGRRNRVMVYVMRRYRALTPPLEGYEATLREGYAQCAIPAAQLDAAIAHSTPRPQQQPNWPYAWVRVRDAEQCF